MCCPILPAYNWMQKKCRPLLPNDQLCPAKTFHKTFFAAIPKESSLQNMHHLIWHWIENWPLQHLKINFTFDVRNKRRMHLIILLLVQRPHLGTGQVLVWHGSNAECRPLSLNDILHYNQTVRGNLTNYLQACQAVQSNCQELEYLEQGAELTWLKETCWVTEALGGMK